MPPSDNEVMMSVTSHDAVVQAQTQAMRAMSDQMGLLARNVERLAGDVQATRDGVIELKAQDLKASILAVRTEAMAEIEKIEGMAQTNAKAISRINGIFLPFGVLGAGLLTYIGQLLANLTSGGHHP